MQEQRPDQMVSSEDSAHLVIEEILRDADSGAFDSAREKASELCDYVPAGEQAWARWNSVLERLSLTAQSEITTRRYLAKYPKDSRVRLYLAARLFSVQRSAEGLAELRVSMEQPIQSGEFLLRATQLYMRVGEWSKVLEIASRGLCVDPENFWMRQNYAEALLRLGKKQQARLEARKLVAGLRGNLTRISEMIAFVSRWRMADLAHASYDEALKVLIDGADAASWQRVAGILIAHPNSTISSRYCGIVTANDVRDPFVLRVVFDYAYSEGKYDVARAIGIRLIRVNPVDSTIAQKLDALNRLQTQLF